MGQVDGKIAIVTGGASGIGAACATTLAREGAKLVVTDLDDAGGRRVVDQIGGAGGAEVARLDVADDGGARAHAIQVEEAEPECAAGVEGEAAAAELDHHVVDEQVLGGLHADGVAGHPAERERAQLAVTPSSSCRVR